MTPREIRKQVEEWVDDLRSAATVAERDATDDGTRIALDDVIRDLGLDPDELRGGGSW